MSSPCPSGSVGSGVGPWPAVTRGVQAETGRDGAGRTWETLLLHPGVRNPSYMPGVMERFTQGHEGVRSVS